MFLCSIDSLASTIFWNLLPLGIKNFSRGPGYLWTRYKSITWDYQKVLSSKSILHLGLELLSFGQILWMKAPEGRSKVTISWEV